MPTAASIFVWFGPPRPLPWLPALFAVIALAYAAGWRGAAASAIPLSAIAVLIDQRIGAL